MIDLGSQKDIGAAVPSLEKWKRHRDVIMSYDVVNCYVLLAVIDLGSQKKDIGLRGAAVRSLEKWKRLSHNASVSALVRTLKTIKKQAVVNKIEKQINTVR